MSKKVLVAYFSASGVTARAAKNLVKAVDGDIFEIKPAVPYTNADLNWQDKGSRSSVEMADPNSRPAIAEAAPDVSKYDLVLIGFPVWWYVAPTIINTFIESGSFAGKNVAFFCTSGGSGVEGCEQAIRKTYKDIAWKKGRRLTGRESANDLRQWVESI